MLGTQSYARLRFGIGNDFPRGTQIDYVLGNFTLDQRQMLPTRINVAIDALKEYVLAGIQTAMCNYNNK
jgi:PTH1 family peptidyl-tRNA hydrolase